MTTAHRPTFYNALGGANQGGNLFVTRTSKVSARDLPGQTVLKTRDAKPLEDEQTRREAYRSKLEERERLNKKPKEFLFPLEAISNKVPEALLPDPEVNPFPEDSDDEGPARPSSSLNRGDADDDDDDDEEEALLSELAKLKHDREMVQRKKEEELAAQAEIEDRSRMLQANPLLVDDRQSELKRRWDEDVVFRNQVKDAPKAKKRFINDTVRSDFHRKFLAKYVH